MSNQKKTHEELTELISTITSSRDKIRKDYEGFEIISDNLDNKLTKKQLIQAINIMWELVMTADKQTRDDKYLFARGVLEFNEGFKKKVKSDPNFEMPKEQIEKVKTKIENLKPLVEFLIKMKDVVQ